METDKLVLTKKLRDRLLNEEAIHVLLIEDNPGDADLVKLMLFDHGIRVTEVGRVNDAISLLSNKRFDIILLDLSLPDAHGMEAVHLVKQEAFNTPIVILSGSENDELSMQAVKNGAQDFLRKGEGDSLTLKKSIYYAIERHKHERMIANSALYDPLTGLANRLLFHQNLERSISRAERNDTMLAVMFIDLDRFKQVNDTMGHLAGDELLIQVAGRLTDAVRESDTVSRLGGDEFTIILENIPDRDTVDDIAKKIIERIHEPMHIDNQLCDIGASIGIATYPTDGVNAESLIRHADMAMYHTKQRSGESYHYYSKGDSGSYSLDQQELKKSLNSKI
ncbi:MAG: diguanylate cyclase domain-containing protein [Gammaproteobacteria bacterium]